MRPKAVQKAQGAYGIRWRRLFRPGITGWVASNRARKVELLQVYGSAWEAYCYISDVILSRHAPLGRLLEPFETLDSARLAGAEWLKEAS